MHCPAATAVLPPPVQVNVEWDPYSTVDGARMPSDDNQSAMPDGMSDGETLPSFVRPDGSGAPHAPKTLQALGDGVGVYIASLSSPFLTAPPNPNGASHHPDSVAADQPERSSDGLSELAEPLRQSVEAVPLRLRLNEDELSRVVTAVLELISRYLPIVGARAGGKH